jgi:hypothetical protein
MLASSTTAVVNHGKYGGESASWQRTTQAPSTATDNRWQHPPLSRS